MEEECRRKRQIFRNTSSDCDWNSEIPPIVYEVLHSPGQPLDPATRASVEPRFGHDFSKVRVHTDTKSSESAQAVKARAYTVGSNIVFGEREYSTRTMAGTELLAHELTHVIQQEGLTDASLIQRLPEGQGVPLKGTHVPRAPLMRPVEGEVVRGFPVTRTFCHCDKEIEREEQDIEKMITAFKKCERLANIGILGLNWCVRNEVYRPLVKEKAQQVPAAASADIISGGAMKWPEEQKRQKRAEMLGKSAEGPCIPMLWWATQVHETQHYEQAAEMASQLGPEFYKEFERLAGDPKRLEKLRTGDPNLPETLRKKYPKEVYQYETKMLYRDVHHRVEMELDSFRKEKELFAEVRRVLARICRNQPGQPSIERPESTIPPLHRREV